MKERKIKQIEYFTATGKADPSKAGERFKTRSYTDRVELYDRYGNLLRENGFDNDLNEDFITEYKYDAADKLIEKTTFKNYNDQPRTKERIDIYHYTDGLLQEIVMYFGTVDSNGYYAKSVFTYNDRNQKVKEEYVEKQNAVATESRLFDWHSETTYTEKRINANGELAELHVVKRDLKGKEIEHKMNVEPVSEDDDSLPIWFEYTYDKYGNEVSRIKKVKGEVVEQTSYLYQYENSAWNYRVFKVGENSMWTQFRKIEYY